MQRVLVLDKNEQPLMPCHPARARELLKTGKAQIFRHTPFTIILTEREGGGMQPVTIEVNAMEDKTHIVLTADFKRGKEIIWEGELPHRPIRRKRTRKNDSRPTND